MELTHFDENGNARMVDVGDKDVTKRIAIAEGKIFVSKEVYDAIKNKEVKKGDVLTVATTAGIMGVNPYVPYSKYHKCKNRVGCARCCKC